MLGTHRARLLTLLLASILLGGVMLYWTCWIKPAVTQPAKEPRATVVTQTVKEAHPVADLYGDPLPSGAIARLGTVRFRHGGQVVSLAVSPDGKLVASVGGWHACIWEVDTGKLIHEFPDADGQSRCQFSADGRILMIMQLGRVHLWEVTTGKKIASFHEQKAGGAVAALSPDGKTIALAGEGKPEKDKDRTGMVRVRDVATGKELFFTADHPTSVNQIAFTPDGKTIISASLASHTFKVEKASWVKRWDAVTGKPEGETALLRGMELTRLVIADDGKTVVVAPNYQDDAPQFWDVGSGNQLPVRLKTGRTIFMALSPDGKKLVASGDGNRTKVWDVTTGSEICQLDGDWRDMHALAFTPHGQTLITAGILGSIRRWNAGTGKEIEPSDSPYGAVYAAVFSPDGKLVATSGDDKSVYLWETRTGKTIHRLPDAGSTLSALAFTPDGKTLVTQGGLIWDVQTGKQIARFQPLPAPREALLRNPALSPDGKTLAFIGPEIMLFDMATRKELCCFGKESQTTGPLAFSRDGKLLAYGKSPKVQWQPFIAQPQVQPAKPEPHNALLLWDVATGQLLREGPGPNDSLRSVTFTPDGHTILGIIDNQVQAWETKTCQPVQIFPAVRANGLVLLPDGATLALACGNEVQLWDLKTQKQLTTLRGHRGSFTQGLASQLALSADGKLLATAGNDATVLIWDVEHLLHQPLDR